MLNEAKYFEVVTSTSPTVTGYLSESAKKIAAKKNSFHTLMKLMPVNLGVTQNRP